ncbi:hypothetical protein KIW84_032376 [Lathyrus oleraceus]|uniref:Uncharacterized protein n=1 Tax=Pisum sativum TaxID=3888 RepID=A0A9D5B1S4_PEA|nr:hypothetical protein KIW84_032376 [Pisum sativum]
MFFIHIVVSPLIYLCPLKKDTSVVSLNDGYCFLSIHYSARPREEQYLAKWASPRLRDSASLEQIVDPSMKTKLPFKALSCYADLISLCIQVLTPNLIIQTE